MAFGEGTFLRHILDSTSTLKSSSHKFRFTPEFYADLLWWVNFLAVFNGKQMFLDTLSIVDVETNACF